MTGDPIPVGMPREREHAELDGQPKRAEEAAARSARRMSALYQLTDRLQHAATVDEIHQAALAAIGQALGCDRASILLFDAAGVMRFVAWQGLSERYRHAVEGHSPWGPEERDPKPLGIDDLAAADLPAPIAQAIEAERIRAAAFVPLAGDAGLIGKFMVYYDAPHAFAEDELEAALIIGRQIAFGLQRLRAEAERREAAERLRSSEQELSDFFESAAVGLHWVGADGIILRANRAELDMLGYVREEYVGRHIAEFHVDRPVIEDMLARLHRGEVLRDHPARMRHKDGSILDVLVHSSVLFDNGRFVHTRCFTYDVTERKRSEAALVESERRMRLVADNLPALIGYVDREHRYRFLNARYGEWFGVDHGTLTGIHMRDLLGDELYEVRLPYIERVLRGETVRFERITRHHRLGERATDMAYVPHIGRDGKVEGFYVMGFDITERKRTEEALKETDRRKDEFIATLSHELRNPLAPLKNSLHVLRLVGANAAAAAPVHAMMERQVDHLVRLVDDLLEMSRISRGTFELRCERVELATIVRNAVETSDPLIERARHRLELELPRAPVWLDGDPVRLAQILSNLLNNAAKYTPLGGRIVLRAEAQSGLAVISVRDNGAGIAPEALSRIFEMFSRGEQAGEAGDSSLGIGLPLARRLAQMHGGSIEAASQGRGKGAEFVVRLPLSADQVSAGAGVQAGAGASVAHTRVLVVYDNRDAAESLGMLLQALGAEVCIVHAGAPAL